MPKSLEQKHEERLAAQLRNLRLAGRSGDGVTPSRQLRWAVYQLVLAAAGVDPVTLEWNGEEYAAEDVRQRLIVPLEPIWDYLHAEVHGVTTKSCASRTPVMTLGNALRMMFGLDHHPVGSHRWQHYAVDTDVLARQLELLSKIQGPPSTKN